MKVFFEYKFRHFRKCLFSIDKKYQVSSICPTHLGTMSAIWEFVHFDDAVNFYRHLNKNTFYRLTFKHD